MNKSETIKFSSGCGNIFFTVTYKDNKVIKILPRLGKSGTCAKVFLHVIGELLSFIMILPKKDAIKVMVRIVGHKCSENFCIEPIIRFLIDKKLEEEEVNE